MPEEEINPETLDDLDLQRLEEDHQSALQRKEETSVEPNNGKRDTISEMEKINAIIESVLLRTERMTPGNLIEIQSLKKEVEAMSDLIDSFGAKDGARVGFFSDSQLQEMNPGALLSEIKTRVDSCKNLSSDSQDLDTLKVDIENTLILIDELEKRYK